MFKCIAWTYFLPGHWKSFQVDLGYVIYSSLVYYVWHMVGIIGIWFSLGNSQCLFQIVLYWSTLTSYRAIVNDLAPLHYLFLMFFFHCDVQDPTAHWMKALCWNMGLTSKHSGSLDGSLDGYESQRRTRKMMVLWDCSFAPPPPTLFPPFKNLSSWCVRQRGFQNLYTLKGGVSHYLKNEGPTEWVGNLFVFDSRLSLPPSAYKPKSMVKVSKGELVSKNNPFARCYICGSQVSELRHRNCANLDCNLLFL